MSTRSPSDFQMERTLLSTYNKGWHEMAYSSQEEKEELLRRMNRAKLRINRPVGLDLEIGKEDTGIIRFNVRDERRSKMDGESTRLSPEQHYQAGMEMLRQAHTLGIGTSLEALLAALTHSMLGGLSDGLDYAERQRVSAPKPPAYESYIEEEDENRP